MIIVPDTAKQSPNAKSWAGQISTWDGSTELGPAWNFTYPTIIIVTIAGEVTQGAGAFPATGSTWPATGLVDGTGARSGMIGYRLASAQGSAMSWPTKTMDTVVVQNEMRAQRGAINGAQPNQYPNPSSCGSYNNETPRLACYTYTGVAHLEFTRPHVDLTLTRAGSGDVAAFSEVTFTAGTGVATIGALAVPMSEVQWNWLPDANVDDAVVCSGGATTCTFAPISPGTLYVSAYVNGEWQFKGIHVDVVGYAKPTPCAEISFVATNYPEIASPKMDEVKQKIWSDSRVRGVELGGYVIQNGGVYDLDATGWTSYPCSATFPAPPAGALGTIHPHVQPSGTDISLFCRSFVEDTYAAGHLQSREDYWTARMQFATAPNQFILTGSRIIVYRWNPNPGPGLAPRMDMIVLPRCGY
ncbi:MAG TPA: hypothetical protein VM033_05200 [Gemmatimonadaceae bacterium]|nr:hypothetical protein [Gemmatimonadaceae bacterium]